MQTVRQALRKHRYKRFPREESWPQITRNTEPPTRSRFPKVRTKASSPDQHSERRVPRAQKCPRRLPRRHRVPSTETGQAFASGCARLLPEPRRAVSSSAFLRTRGCPCNSSFKGGIPNTLSCQIGLAHCRGLALFCPTTNCV